MTSRLKNISKTLGPGILFASTCIGVSHLMQSTRAGAEYGFALIAFVIAANILKFPFFEFGSRYANATNSSLIDGYNKLSKWVLYIYALIVLGTMFFVTAAVVFVTAAFFENLFGFYSESVPYLTSLILLLISCLLLGLGKFNLLDNFMKIIGITLLISTVLAFVLVLFKGPINPNAKFFNTALINERSLPFIIALMGWMPTAVDLSTWNSLWTVEKIKSSGYKPSLKETLFEFNLGYWISAALSICFITLGAFLMFETGNEMPAGKASFAAKIISLYTEIFGSWSYYLIAISAFSIMLGTSIGVLDGYSRSASKVISLISNKKETQASYTFYLLFTALGGLGIIILFIREIRTLVDLATTISFLVAPVIAIINLKLVTGNHLKENQKPGRKMLVLSYLGIIFLSFFSLYYIYVKFIS